MHSSSDSLAKIRAAVENPERAFQVIDGGRNDHGGNGGGPPQQGQNEQPCPVTAIGQLDGTYYFLDSVGQIRTIKASDFGKRHVVVGLFGGSKEWLMDRFPKKQARKIKDQEGKTVEEYYTVDFKINDAAEFLQQECVRAGLFGDHIQIRKPGIWPGPGGMPIVHCGDHVLVDSRLERPGTRIGNQIWAAAPPEARPAKPCDAGVARAIQQSIRELWNFRIPGGDILALGLLACAYYGAAIPWRPAGFLTGSAGCGKSSLLNVLKGAAPLKYSTNDTSKAGLEQSVDGRAMPMFIDEASDREDQRGARALLDLVLSAAGGEGTKGSRGSSDGKARKIEVAGSIIMASISPPDMKAQHLGRFIMLELGRPDSGADHSAEHRELAETAKEVGPELWGRALAGWKRFREANSVLRAAVGAAGCVPREMDQLGALLAGWWVLTHDGVPTEAEAADTVRGIEGYIRGEEDVITQDAPTRMVNHLMSQVVQMQRSTERRSLSSLIARMLRDEHVTDDTGQTEISRKICAEILAQYGIRVIRANEPKNRRGDPAPRLSDGDGVWFWPDNSMLIDLFKATPFEGQKWRYEMQRLESARVKKETVTISPSVKKRNCIWVTAIELGVVPDDDL